MNIRKAYRISKPNMLSEGIKENSAVGHWLVSYDIIGRDRLYDLIINEPHITLGTLRRNIIGQAPTPDWTHEERPVTAVRLYDFAAPTAHCEAGWNEIDDNGALIGYDNNKQA